MTHLHTVMVKMFYHNHNILNQVPFISTNKQIIYIHRGNVSYKRAADGNTISTFWGDAKNWASQA